jgi:MFS transporter, DHA3 family, tetracycline resistance protein
VISITNLGDSAGEWGGGPVLGAVGSAFGLRAALSLSALVLVPALWLYGRTIRLGGPDEAYAGTAREA